MSPTKSHSPPAIYSPLDPSEPSTRLLTIEPYHAADQELSCTLAPIRLDGCPPFVALSYVWGDPNVSPEIITINGQLKQIGANLAAALRFFRRQPNSIGRGAGNPPVLPQHIWVDALCINQDDNSEKSLQVGRMGQIYKSASVVLSYLGTERAGDEYYQGYEAIRALGKAWRRLVTDCKRISDEDQTSSARSGAALLDEPKTSALLEDLITNLPKDAWDSIKAFFHLPYWSRIWIIQEIMLGREVMLVLGDLEPITWADLRDAMLLTEQIPGILDGFAVYAHSMWEPFEGSAEIDWEYVELIRRYKEPSRYFQIDGKILLPSALGVMFRTSRHKATNPRDKVFGLSGICELPIQPDYDLPVHQVYTKFALGCVYYEQFNIFLLAGRGLPLGPDTLLPSWVPDWEAMSLAAYHNPINPESYTASGWIDPFPHDPPETSSCLANLSRGFLLTLNSLKCDTISSIWTIPAADPSSALYALCCELMSLHSLDATGAPILQSLLRAICLDKPLDSDTRGPMLDFAQGDIDAITPPVLDFLSIIIPGTAESASEDTNTSLAESLSALGLDPGYNFLHDLKEKFFPRNGGSLQTIIDFGDPKWEDDVLAGLFPNMDLSEVRSQPVIRRSGVEMVKRGSGLPVRKQLLARMDEWIGPGYSVFLTEKGHVGIGPPGIENGDTVHVVRRCAAPIALRENGVKEEGRVVDEDGDERSEILAVNQLVGGCCLVGFMHNELGIKDDSLADGMLDDDNDEEEEGEGRLNGYIRQIFPDLVLVR